MGLELDMDGRLLTPQLLLSRSSPPNRDQYSSYLCLHLARAISRQLQDLVLAMALGETMMMATDGASEVKEGRSKDEQRIG